MNNIKRYIKKLGIDIKENSEVPIARTFFDEKNKKFIIEVNPAFASEDAVLEHELLHIYRLDLFVEERDFYLWNIASDIVITNVLLSANRMPENIKNLIIVECPCGFREWRSGAKVIYEHLLTHKNEFQFQSPCFVPCDEEGKKEAERIRRKILKDYENAEDVPNAIEKYITERAEKEAQKQQQRQAGKSKTDFSIVLPVPKSNPILRKIMQFSSEEGDSEFIRRYETFRNNRNPFIKRELEIPENSSMMFIIDVSGSMDAYIQDILSAIRYFEKENAVEKLFFSDTILYSTRKKYVNAGGGTQFIPVLNFLKKRKKKYSLICLFSDYQFFDISEKQAIQELKKYAKILILFNERLEVKKI